MAIFIFSLFISWSSVYHSNIVTGQCQTKMRSLQFTGAGYGSAGRWLEVTACERNVRSPGTSWERAIGDVRMLVPLDRGLSASGSAHNLSLPSSLRVNFSPAPAGCSSQSKNPPAMALHSRRTFKGEDKYSISLPYIYSIPFPTVLIRKSRRNFLYKRTCYVVLNTI